MGTNTQGKMYIGKLGESLGNLEFNMLTSAFLKEIKILP